MKTLTRSAAGAAVLLLLAGSVRADFPAFLILQEGGSFTDRAEAVEGAGARIRHRVPPRILIVDLPDGARASSLPGVQTAYVSAITVSTLDPQGPAAVAAGLQWNRRLLTNARVSNAGSLGFMRQVVSERSLPAPANLRVTAGNGRLACEWNAIDGAPYYEVQASASPDFEGPAVRTHVVGTRVEIAAPEGAAEAHVRVRAVDNGEAGTEDDVNGRWSSVVRAAPGSAPAAGGTAPVLTSPSHRIEVEGFTLILEWTPGDGPARVQVARDSGFSDVVFDELATGGEYACPGPALRTGDRLYWRVQSWNGARSAWSSVREARIGEPRSTKIDAFVNPEAPQ